MARLIECKVEGLQGLERALTETTVKKARSALREAAEKAAEFMRVSLVLAAPSLSGFLARHFVSKISLSARNDTVTASVGPSREAYYAQFVEFGSVHNEPPQPFIRQTFNNAGPKQLEVFIKTLKEALGLDRS